MAVYRCEVRRFSRSAGQSAVASAAYRTADRVRQEKNGAHQPEAKVHDYRRRAPGVAYRETMAPEHAPEWATERGRLWNEAERAENRKNSVTAREALVSLPHELDDVQRIELVRGFAGRLIDRYGVAVDIAIHRPDRKGDQRNHHAHVMFTTRRMGRDGLAEKTRELDDRITGPKEIELIREMWEQQQNQALERAGKLERVSRLSNAAQGIEREPQPKLGETFTALGRQDRQPRAVESWREVARRRALTKDENRPPEQRRHRLERQALAQRYARRGQQPEKAQDRPTPALSTMRANMARQAERQHSAKVEAEKQEAIARALEAAQMSSPRGGFGKTAQRPPAGDQEATRAWERQRQAELRTIREAQEQQNQNPNDLGRVRKPPAPGKSD